jgi:hypothetical protein
MFNRHWLQAAIVAVGLVVVLSYEAWKALFG